jgi:hypothetical protein
MSGKVLFFKTNAVEADESFSDFRFVTNRTTFCRPPELLPGKLGRNLSNLGEELNPEHFRLFSAASKTVP